MTIPANRQHWLWSWNGNGWIHTTSGPKADMETAAVRQANTARDHEVPGAAFVVTRARVRPYHAPRDMPGAFRIMDTGDGTLSVVRVHAAADDPTGAPSGDPELTGTHTVWVFNPPDRVWTWFDNGSHALMEATALHFQRADLLASAWGTAYLVLPAGEPGPGTGVDPLDVPGARRVARGITPDPAPDHLVLWHWRITDGHRSFRRADSGPAAEMRELRTRLDDDRDDRGYIALPVGQDPEHAVTAAAVDATARSLAVNEADGAVAPLVTFLWRWSPTDPVWRQITSGTPAEIAAEHTRRFQEAVSNRQTGTAFTMAAHRPTRHPIELPGASVVHAYHPGNGPDIASTDMSAQGDGAAKPARILWSCASVRVGDLGDPSRDSGEDVVMIGGQWVMVLHAFDADWAPSDHFRLHAPRPIVEQVDDALSGDHTHTANRVVLVVTGRDGMAVHTYNWFDLITVQIPAAP